MNFYGKNLLNISKETAFDFEPTLYYNKLSEDFGSFHQDRFNVLFHLVTTPLGLIGAVALLKSYTQSSSLVFSLTSIYLLSLLPAVPNGVFIGTAIISVIIIQTVNAYNFRWHSSLALIVFGYMVQDISHIATGEETFQSTYSAGGEIDWENPLHWFRMLLEHCYYLLPLVVHISVPFLQLPKELITMLNEPVPMELQRLSVFGWFIGPMFFFALGSYCLDSKNNFCCFPGSPYCHRIIQCSLLTGVAANDGDFYPTKDSNIDNSILTRRNTRPRAHESRQKDLKCIRDWTIAHQPSTSQSSHWWFADLSGAPREAFQRIVNSTQVKEMFRTLFSPFHYKVDAIDGMNEIYVSGPPRQSESANSDHVFYSRHVDGPFGLIPFVSVYRCIVGMDKNQMIATNFPLANITSYACEGDVLAFDYNREVHYITCDDSKRNSSDSHRVVLKLHYCVYPRILAPLGWLLHVLNVYYNTTFRALFLKTLNPATLYEHFLAWQVNLNTLIFDRVETLLGQRNILYVMLVLAVSYVTSSYELFFALTSFVHYFRYISTFYVRKGIDFGSFKRDVLLFKSLALGQLFYHYVFPQQGSFSTDPVSIFMILTGYSISILATDAIGVDRTYFAAELGLVEPKWINRFPYGFIPHPMIVSQIWALLGLHKAAHFRLNWPYVVPIHIALYLIHMTQEVFDVYKRYPDSDCCSPRKGTSIIVSN